MYIQMSGHRYVGLYRCGNIEGQLYTDVKTHRYVGLYRCGNTEMLLYTYVGTLRCCSMQMWERIDGGYTQGRGTVGA